MSFEHYDRFCELACPKCGAAANERCVARASGNITYAHRERRRPGSTVHTPQYPVMDTVPPVPPPGEHRPMAREAPLSEPPPMPTERQSWFSGLGGRGGPE